MVSFFISDALAAAQSTSANAANGLFSFLPLIGLLVLSYFVLIRPQTKRAKLQQQMLSQLKKGDEVVTVGGVLGKISHIDEQYVKLSINESTEMHLQRNAVSSILPKGTIKAL